MNLLPPRVGEDGRLEITIELELSEAPRECAQWLKARALWVGQDFTAKVSLLEPICIVLVVAAHATRLKARCVQLSEKGAAFELLELEELQRLVDHVGAAEPEPELPEDSDEAQEVGEGDVPLEEGPKGEDSDTGEDSDAGEDSDGEEAGAPTEEPKPPQKPKTEGTGSLFHRLKALSIEEKKRLAVKGNQPERHFLARDNAQGIHIFVLRNPGVSATEVAEFLKYPRLSSEAIMHIAKTSEWMTNRRVMMGLCMHSRTPTNITMRLLSKLSARDLKALQRSGKMKPVLAREIKSRLYKLNHEK